MFSIHQLLKALRKLQANEINASDLVKSLQYAMIAGHNNSLHSATAKHVDTTPLWMTSFLSAQSMTSTTTSSKTHIAASSTAAAAETAIVAQEGEEATATATVTVSPKQQQQTRASSHEHEINETENISKTSSHCQQMSNIESSSSSSNSNSHKLSISEHVVSLYSNLNEVGSLTYTENTCTTTTQDSSKINIPTTVTTAATTTSTTPQQNFYNLNRSQSIQNFYQQQLHQFHTQHNQSLYAKQKQIQFAMSSLAAEPLSLKSQDEILTKHSISNGDDVKLNGNEIENDSSTSNVKSPTSPASGKPCFNTGLAEILQFMELIGNLKHTKRTGWVLRDVNDCESISGHMYRMSMMTFLLDGTEGLNQIRCMELALVHDLAESLVGDITPFCGVSKDDKRSMEFKAMEEICKLIEPRGKRIMELFEEYEHAQSAESKFVKDLDRLDMVMQAFEYEKRDNCLLKHQEFFDSTEGKFQHPFVQKLVQEIYEQRRDLAMAKGATPPPTMNAPKMEEIARKLNGHCAAVRQQQEQQQEQSTSTSTS